MKKGLTANTIKAIAILAMTFDHIAWILNPDFPRDILSITIHLIGRITCPIMCYFIAEGFHYTKNINHYTARLFLFALLSGVPYRFAFLEYWDVKRLIPFSQGNPVNQTSVIWALAWGLVMLRIAYSTKIRRDITKVVLIFLVCLISFPADWSCIASLCILMFGLNRGNFKKQIFGLLFFVAIYSIVYSLVMDPVYGLLQMAVALAIPLLYLYNGERGGHPSLRPLSKWFFYVYYPLHLVVLGLLHLYKII